MKRILNLFRMVLGRDGHNIRRLITCLHKLVFKGVNGNLQCTKIGNQECTNFSNLECPFFQFKSTKNQRTKNSIKNCFPVFKTVTFPG
jgi:hypothetical protein